MPSIALDCEPASAPSTHTSPVPPNSRGHSPPQQTTAATLYVVSQPAHQQQQQHRFAAYSQAMPTSSNSGFLSTPLEQYRLQLYNYAVHMERLRCPQYATNGQQLMPSAAAAVAAFGYSNVAAAAAAAAAVGSANGSSPYAPGSRLALSMSLFPQRIFQPEEPKPQHSYIGLIAMAILSSVDTKLVLSDIYQYILDNYPYFRTRGPGWRNSIRHNLSLNDCFVKSGRSANGKGHYWAIHPANMEDFRKGDFRRRKAQRKVRKHMGLSVDDEGTDSPSPPPLAVTPPPTHHAHHHLAHAHASQLDYLQQHHQQQQQHAQHAQQFHHHHHQHYGPSFVAAAAAAAAAAAVAAGSPTSAHYPSPADVTLPTPHNGCNKQLSIIKETTTTTASVIANLYSQTRKRQFDVASLLAPDVEVDVVDDSQTIERAAAATTTTTTTKRTLITKLSVQQHHHHHHHHLPTYAAKQLTTQQQLQQNLSELDEQEDIDVVASDVEEDVDAEAEIDADELDEAIDELVEEEEDDKQHEIENEENNNTKAKKNNGLHAFGQVHQQQKQLATVEPTTYTDYQHTSNSHNSPNSSNQLLQSTPQQNQQENLQRLMHQLPNELSHVDPRIFGRYYGTYMAAAAAQQVVTRHISSSISFPLATAAAATPANMPPAALQQHLPQQQQQHPQQQQQPLQLPSQQ